MNTTKEQNMINMSVGNPTHNAYVRIENINRTLGNINCTLGPINENSRKINAIKAVRNIALMDRDSRSATCTPTRMGFLAGLKEAKDFVESFLIPLNEAYNTGKPMVLTSDVLHQDELEMIVAVIMFNTPCRYEVYYRP